MKRFICHQNIERFERLLASASDERSRTILLELIAQEQEKLSAMKDEDNAALTGDRERPHPVPTTLRPP